MKTTEIDPITSEDISEVLKERQMINEQLEFDKERFAKKAKLIDLNKPATLTKAEKKMLKDVKRQMFWLKIKNILFGEKDNITYGTKIDSLD